MDARVRFRLSGRAAGTSAGEDVSKAVNVPTGSALIDAIARARLPLASACGADGLCGRCGVAILAGESALAPETEDELRIKSRNRIDPKLRLACRTIVAVDLEITASYW
ncbi:MAG: 2Fe-2S iron-sulfur cluster-binding protein [Myxococcota bacterium]